MRCALAAATLCRTTQHDWQGRRLADQTLFWLDFGTRSVLLNADSAEPLTREARELLAIVIASAKTAAANSPDRRP